MDSNRLYRWIVSLLKGIWEWIKSLFMGAFSDKLENLRKQFSADELFKLFGNDTKNMDAATEALRVQAEKIQRLVATGIGGAASASIDMILNAFSMSPVFGTTILVWRMFQNMLMIMGASLSVQAASNSGATTLATIANPKLAEPPTSKGGGGKAKNNVTKRIKTDIRQLNRSLKRYMHFPHRHRQHGPKGMKGTTMSGSGAGSGYSYT
jgi:plasmid maintenance system antidote protein VapI